MENQPTDHCRNCQSNLSEGAKFCPACGQKNTDGRFTFGELLEHLIENIFSLDARIFQTLDALIRPGKLTESFFQGKHIRYYHPVRLFLFSAALLIAVISLSIPEGATKIADESWKEREAQVHQKNLLVSLDSLVNDLKIAANETETISSLDTVAAKLHKLVPDFERDSISINQIISFGSEKHDRKLIAINDVMMMSPDSLCKKYEVTGLINRMVVMQNVRIMASPSSFMSYLISNTIWMTLIMMPMLALVLKLVHTRQPFLYYEHLVFSFHIHTFLFLVAALLVAMLAWLGTAIVIIGITLSLIYPLLAQKRFYKQSWPKTILKSLIISILYLIISTLSIFLFMITSIFLF